MTTVSPTELPPARLGPTHERAAQSSSSKKKKGAKVKISGIAWEPGRRRAKTLSLRAPPRAPSPPLPVPSSPPPPTDKSDPENGGSATTGESGGAKARHLMASWCDNLAPPPRVLIGPREHPPSLTRLQLMSSPGYFRLALGNFVTYSC
jgi:hypothetical protein